MIDKIVVNNFATIEHLEADFGMSLNVITGETGAGKSVLVEAINTALGGRADISMIRTGTDKATIQILISCGADFEDSENIIITRELLASGKSVSKINSEIVTLTHLRAFCRNLIDVHGQYDNQRMLDPANHIHLLDTLHGEELSSELNAMSSLYEDYSAAYKSYENLLIEESESRRQKDFYQFEYDYITSLDLKVGEEEDLRERLSMIKNSEKIFSAIGAAYSGLHDDEHSAISLIGAALNAIKDVSQYGESIASIAERLENIYYELDDISSLLRDQIESVNFSADDLDMLQGRLSAIEDARRKYGDEVTGILAYRDELERKLEMISDFDYAKEKLSNELEQKHIALENKASVLSELRHKNAAVLESDMKKELDDLNFANSDFAISITKTDSIGITGFDDVEFLISTNPGEPLMPLSKIASGGELSRIMLAFKHITGDNDKVNTMIFDEIDTGISGKTALIVGRKLREISLHHQIICITHLPQIAACGNDNYKIVKSVGAQGKSSTTIEHLNEGGKLRSIADLISGDEHSANALQAAKDLISSVTSE